MNIEDVIEEVAVEGLPSLIEFIVEAVQSKRIDPLRARELLEAEMTAVADAQMRRELGP